MKQSGGWKIRSLDQSSAGLISEEEILCVEGVFLLKGLLSSEMQSQ